MAFIVLGGELQLNPLDIKDGGKCEPRVCDVRNSVYDALGPNVDSNTIKGMFVREINQFFLQFIMPLKIMFCCAQSKRIVPGKVCCHSG